MMQFLGGTPYPVFEVLILLAVLFFATSIYFGLNYETLDLKESERREPEEVSEP